MIAQMPDKEPRILERRIGEHRANMQRVIDAIAAAVASATTDSSEGGRS